MRALGIALVAGFLAVAFMGSAAWASPGVLHHASSAVVPTSRPDAGTTLSLAGLDPTAVAFTWPPSGFAGTTSYAVNSSTSASGPWTLEDNVSNPAQSWDVFTGLTPGATLYWQVVYWAVSGSTYYVEDSTAVLSVTQPALSVLSASATGSTTVHLAWTNSAQYGVNLSFASYQVLESVNGGSFSVIDTITSASTLSATVSGLSASTRYTFQINTTDSLVGPLSTSSVYTLSNAQPVSTPSATGGTSSPLTGTELWALIGGALVVVAAVVAVFAIRSRGRKTPPAASPPPPATPPPPS